MRFRRMFLLFLLSLPVLANGATLIPMFLDDLTSASQTIVHGNVVASRVEWDAGRTMIYTVYTIQPAQYLKGHLGAVFEIREPGGELPDIGMKVSGAPHFQVGQEAVLFVWTDPKGFHQIAGFEQGAVRIATDPATGMKSASRSIPLGSARAARIAVASQPATGKSLPQLFDQVRFSVARTSQGRAGE